MALFHLSVTQTKRSAGQSAIASAAYRAGERLYSEYYGEYSDYTRKGGVICSDILLPSHAPPEYADRQTLWNAVEKAERGKNAQLAYSFEISLQNEFSLEENIALAREFLFREFVSRGMTVDVSFHEKECEDGGTPNPHFHFLCPIRPMEQDGTWGIKQRREYVLDEEGNRIRDANGKYVFNAVPTTDWGSPETLEHWRERLIFMNMKGEARIAGSRQHRRCASLLFFWNRVFYQCCNLAKIHIWNSLIRLLPFSRLSLLPSARASAFGVL